MTEDQRQRVEQLETAISRHREMIDADEVENWIADEELWSLVPSLYVPDEPVQ